MIAFLPISARTEFHVPVSETNVREQLLILVTGIMLIGEQNVKQKSVVVAILFPSTVVLAFQS